MKFFKSLVVVALAIAATMFGVADSNAAAPNGPVLYVVTQGHLTTYQVGTWTQLSSVAIPFSDSVRGVDVDLSRSSLYIAHGGHGGTSGNGSLMRYNFVTNTVVWNKVYTHGVDQPAVCGGIIYLPSGSGTGNSTWYELNADTGASLGTLSGGSHPHNTICHNEVVYMGGENTAFLYQHGGTGPVQTGPVSPLGIRPFTVNNAGTRTWITQSNYRGFSVGDLTTGKTLSTVKFGANPSSSPLSAYSHGISLSPNGSEIYVLDTVVQTVRVYSSADKPVLLASIKLKTPISGQDTPCTKSCTREGWLLHSYDGRYVFVGDSGDVIDTTTRTVVAHVPALQNSRHGYLEIDWAGGVPAITNTHFGVSH